MISLEPLTDGSLGARNFETLRRLVLDTGGTSLSMRVGATTFSWTTGLSVSGVRTVTHGLGKVPIFVGVFGLDVSAAVEFACYPYSPTSTQFSATAFFRGTVTAGSNVTYNACWVVIG